jgi:hypothetical protein
MACVNFLTPALGGGVKATCFAKFWLGKNARPNYQGEKRGGECKAGFGGVTTLEQALLPVRALAPHSPARSATRPTAPAHPVRLPAWPSPPGPAATRCCCRPHPN